MNHRLRLGRAAPYIPALAILALQLLVFPLPTGQWVRGAVVGAATALIALGMALIYRSNRIVNFAQGDLGAAPAVLVFLLLSEWGWPYPVAVAVGAAAAFLLGGLTEVAVIRRFFRSPRLVVTVATIGLAQLLTGLAFLLPVWFDTRLLAPQIVDPFDLRFQIGETIFRANSVIAAVTAPLAMVALALFLKTTRIGVAVRAAADRSDRASLLGIPVKRLQALVWAVAGLLAFTATFLRAGMLGLPVGSVLSLGILLRSLSALLLGGLTHLPAIGTTAVALGVLELGVDWNASSPLLLDPILAGVIVVALLLRRRNPGRTDIDDQSSWQTVDEARPVPSELARLPEVRWVRLGLFVLLAAVLVGLPHVLAVDQSLKASAVGIYALIALSLVVLTGWAGQVSIGQVAFFAIGAAVGGKLTATWDVDLLLAIAGAGVVGALAATVVGLPALRFRGLYLAVTTFAFALATTSYLLNRQWFDWVPNSRIPRKPLLGRLDISSATSVYYLVLGAFVLAAVGVQGIRRSRTGRVLVAMRDNERAAQSFGISAVRAKLTAFAVSGFIAAAAGAIFVHHQQALGELPYAPSQNLAVFAMAVVGGIASIPGALLGAMWFQGIANFLPIEWQFLASGFGVLLVLLILPGGLGGLLYTVRNHYLRWVATRRGIVVPSLLADSDTTVAPGPARDAVDDELAEVPDARRDDVTSGGSR